MDILKKIIATKQRELLVKKRLENPDRIESGARACLRRPLSLSRALRRSPNGIIAEFKRKSPSKGHIREGADARTVTAGYEQAGAAAVSVLTDSGFFGGSLDDLAAAREVLSIPILRKDFIVDSYQIAEARLSGADAILLIAAALTPARTRSLAAYAKELGLEVLLEIHDERELGHIGDGIDIVGINNRDLTSFETDIRASSRLGALIPPAYVKISESGLASPADLRMLREKGFEGFLIGERLMRENDPADALRQFIVAI